MFFPRTESLALSETSLWGLRVSLNSPVVSIEELPVGPARAAIASHEEADGRPSVTIGIRSMTGGVAVLYSFEDDLREQTSVSVVIDAALSFAESMGFLFDEDEVAPDVPATAARAVGLWDDLMSNAGAVPVAGGPPEEAAEELLLEEAPRPDPVELVEAAEARPSASASAEAGSPPEEPAAADGYVPQFEGDLGVDTPAILEGGPDAANFDSRPSYIGGDDVPIGDLDIGSGAIGAQDAPGDALAPPAGLDLPQAEPVLEFADEVDPAPEEPVQPDAEGESPEYDDDESDLRAEDIDESDANESDIDEPEVGDWELDLPQDEIGPEAIAPSAELEQAEQALAALEASGGEALEALEAESPEAPEPEAVSAGPDRPAAPRLTKFRRPGEPEPEPERAAPPRPAALGRLKLVRRGADGEAAERPEPALRLFGAF